MHKKTEHSKQLEKNNRRKLLRNVAAGGLLVNQIPSQWTKPVVDIALLPAHAATSTVESVAVEVAEPPPPSVCNVDCPGGVLAQLFWSGPNDMDIEMGTPGGTLIAPKAANGVLDNICGLKHQGDLGGDSGGGEVISGSDPLTAGRYPIFVRTDAAGAGAAQLTVTACNISGQLNAVLSGPGLFNAGSINVTAGGTTTVRVSLA